MPGHSLQSWPKNQLAPVERREGPEFVQSAGNIPALPLNHLENGIRPLLATRLQGFAQAAPISSEEAAGVQTIARPLLS